MCRGSYSTLPKGPKRSNTVETIIPVGKTPWGAALCPDGTKVYVANKDDDNISVINTISNTVINTVAVGKNPWGVVINPSGTKAFIANSGSNSVSVIDISSDKVITTIPVGTAPHWLAVSPDGNNVYVTNSADASVSVIDAGSDAVTQTIPVEAHPEGIAAFPDGSAAVEKIRLSCTLWQVHICQVVEVAAQGSNTDVLSSLSRCLLNARHLSPRGKRSVPKDSRVGSVDDFELLVGATEPALVEALFGGMALGTVVRACHIKGHHTRKTNVFAPISIVHAHVTCCQRANDRMRNAR